MMSDNLAFLHALTGIVPTSLAERLAYVTARAEFRLADHVDGCELAVRPNRKIAYRFTLRGMQEATPFPQ